MATHGERYGLACRFTDQVAHGAASASEPSLSACPDAPAALATLAPVRCAPPILCGCKDRSTIHAVAPARASTSATKRASLPLVFSVANTATAGSDALTQASLCG